MLCKQDHKVYEIDPRQCPCYDIPIFHNLTHLELHDTLELVPQVLKYCPKLQNLELYEEEHEEVGSFLLSRASKNHDFEGTWF
ncbi:hypothetical protein P8452_60436 [Trifolium repens]|nr:hypothetical protein P8452_60436 [Trifolium repens]